MQIRAIHPAELGAFVSAGGRAEDAKDTRNYLDRLLAGGYTRLDWCFVAEDGGQLLGRVAYWSLPGAGAPTDIVLLDVPWEGDYRAVGNPLLVETAALMREHGAGDLEYVLDMPPQVPQWQNYPERRHDLMLGAGYSPIRETVRFKWRAGDQAPGAAERLAFRSLAEAGEQAFLDAIQLVLSGSLDQRDREDVTEYGAEETARNMYAIVQSIGYDPAWWELGYNDAGELVGLVMPAATMSWGTIGYIGVVPGQRGHGYIDDLLARGTATLAASSDREIQADTDIANKPMANAFRRAGYTQFGTRREYRWRSAR